ncbi:hypothetical protein H4582DRAFT_245871 [Lactarius indigo]|nr:hypothetical protein H4582DRAFT_245871 [Lactarius indigo]
MAPFWGLPSIALYASQAPTITHPLFSFLLNRKRSHFGDDRTRDRRPAPIFHVRLRRARHHPIATTIAVIGRCIKKTHREKSLSTSHDLVYLHLHRSLIACVEGQSCAYLGNMLRRTSPKMQTTSLAEDCCHTFLRRSRALSIVIPSNLY